MGTRGWSTTSKFMLTISVLLVWAQIPFFVLKTTKPPSVRIGLSSSTADPVQPQNETLTVSPIQVVVAQLTVLDAIPEAYFKNALYPGAFTRHAQKKVECLTGYRTSKLCKQIAKSEWFPNWNTVVKHQDPKRLDQILTEEFREKKGKPSSLSTFNTLSRNSLFISATESVKASRVFASTEVFDAVSRTETVVTPVFLSKKFIARYVAIASASSGSPRWHERRRADETVQKRSIKRGDEGLEEE
eukprot:gene18048-21496_t